jgi:hypothetical protein
MKHDYPQTLARFPHRVESVKTPWGRACIFCLCLGSSNRGREYWQDQLTAEQEVRLDRIILAHLTTIGTYRDAS